MSLYEATCTLNAKLEDAFGRTLNNLTDANAK
jgi:hypothetical protein